MRRPAALERTDFQRMAGLSMDAGFLTSEFRLCDKIADYLADLVAKLHVDPSRFRTLSTSLINEIIELAFRLAQGGGKIEFDMLRDDHSAYLRVGFRCDQRNQALLETVAPSLDARLADGPVRNLMVLANAVDVGLGAQIEEDDRVSLIVEFPLSEDAR